MININDNTKYVIGIDFGHGETAAAVYDIAKKGKPEKINIRPGKDVVPSAVAIILQEGRKSIVIGEEAVDWIESARQTETFQISFKKRPSLMNAEEKTMMVSFMKGVYNGIRLENVTLNDNNHVVFIARPSNRSWDKEEELYVDMATEAGIPVAGVYKESIAAYYRARTTVMTDIDEHAKKGGVLIVDYGSSTIDFTYLNNSLTQPIVEGTEGTDLGASIVEDLIMSNSLKNCKYEEFQKFNRLYGHNPKSNSYNAMLFRFRKAKEEFYSKKTSVFFSCPIDLYDLTATEKEQCGEPDLSRTFKIASEDLKVLLQPYIDKVTKAVSEFKTEYLNENKVSCVFLTGGASSMDFVRDIFMKVFELEEKFIPGDNHPSSIVAEGAAHLGYLFFTYKSKEIEFKNTRDNILNNFNWHQELNAIIYPRVKFEIKNKAWNVMSDWKDGKIKGLDDDGYYTPTVEALKERFMSTFESYQSYNFAEQSNEMIKEKILSNVFSKIKKAFSDYGYNDKLIPKNLDVNISARLRKSGIEKLTRKFTGDGEGNIIYAAIEDAWGFMVGLNLKKTRSNDALERHYKYYYDHYYSILSDSDWDSFLKNDLDISGIESLKRTVCEYVIKETDDYIRYATMRELFGG